MANTYEDLDQHPDCQGLTFDDATQQDRARVARGTLLGFTAGVLITAAVSTVWILLL